MANEIQRQIKAELCRRDFACFIAQVRPGYIFNWHHTALIQLLQKLADREIMRLVVMMPPRHGKSELVSRLFPAWILARNADEQIIAASYSADLAGAMSRDCQNIITSDTYRQLFPGAKLSEGKVAGAVQTNKRFDVVGKRGYYVSAGVGGGITGVGCTVGIIDDPVKNAEEADSETYRERTWNWYTSTFKTRFEPGAIEVICQTRWHEDDLTGRILKNAPEGVAVLKLPAIAEATEPERAKGAALWEGKYDLQALAEIRHTVGTRTWNALYQQTPTDTEGGVYKRVWFGRYDRAKVDLSDAPVLFYVDTAYTDQEENDPCGLLAFVYKGGKYYITRWGEYWLDFNGQLKTIPDFARANGYKQNSVIYVEPKATGKSLVQVVKAAAQTMNIKEAQAPKGSKLARANSVVATVECGNVLLPEGEPWVDNFLTYVCTFPKAAHDEAVDCLTGMIINTRVRGIMASG